MKPPSARMLPALPKEVRASLLRGALSSQAIVVEDWLLHWQQWRARKSREQTPWLLNLWQRTPKQAWKHIRELALPYDVIAPGLALDHPYVKTAWLRPYKSQGLILSVSGLVTPTSFYVFPEGVGGPMHVFTGGGGATIGCTIDYLLGQPDSRGFRCLQERSSWPVPDTNKFEITEESWHWTGNTWKRSGRKRVYIEP